jgi:hypothetical protein
VMQSLQAPRNAQRARLAGGGLLGALPLRASSLRHAMQCLQALPRPRAARRAGGRRRSGRAAASRFFAPLRDATPARCAAPGEQRGALGP